MSSEVFTLIRNGEQNGEQHQVHQIDLSLWIAQGWEVDFSEDGELARDSSGQSSEVEKLRQEIDQLKAMIFSYVGNQIDELIEQTKRQTQKLQEGTEDARR
jgi:hypothetical protein